MGAECTRFCKNNIGGGVFCVERCWGVFAIPSSNPTCVSSYGGGGYLVEKVFGVVSKTPESFFKSSVYKML